MKPPSQMSRTAKLVEGALMIALAFALSYFLVFKMPLGGSVTIFSTLPIIMMSLRHGARWGVLTAFVYSLLQLFQGLNNLTYLHTVWAMALCVLLDYVLAFTALGLAGPIARRFKNPTVGLIVGIVSTGAMRFVCSFFSGLLIWPPDPASGTPAALHSLLYNGSWCGPDVAIVLVAALLLSRVPVLGLLDRPKAQKAAA